MLADSDVPFKSVTQGFAPTKVRSMTNLMSARFPQWASRATLIATLVATPMSSFAQIPGAPSSARSIQTEVEQSDVRITQIISRAEDHFRKGKLNLEDSKREQARDEFDKAVDSILESGFDVRANQKLQTYYLELVERIYREEVPLQGPATPNNAAMTLVAQNTQDQKTPPPPAQIGFRDQKFEPSPLDELSKLVLTESEKEVSGEDLVALEQSKQNVNFAFTLNPLIQQYINYYQGPRGRATMENGLRRSGQYMRLARQIFAKEGVPVDVTWVGSGRERLEGKSIVVGVSFWSVAVRSGTGRTYDLRQTAYIDERNSFEQATRASARYLKDLAQRYNGNWELAMAAYNTGAGNVDRAIARAGTSNFWMIYPYIAQETRNYVPIFWP
jgi:membrane-bound lytic murein transglycosylase D